MASLLRLYCIDVPEINAWGQGSKKYLFLENIISLIGSMSPLDLQVEWN